MVKRGSVSPTARAAGRFVAADSVVATEQADTTILLNLRSGRYYTLNSVSGLIWSILAKGASIEGVVARVQEEFDVPDDQLRGDVDELIASLLSAKLIRRDE
jgi:hypothetical protein